MLINECTHISGLRNLSQNQKSFTSSMAISGLIPDIWRRFNKDEAEQNGK